MFWNKRPVRIYYENGGINIEVAEGELELWVSKRALREKIAVLQDELASLKGETVTAIVAEQLENEGLREENDALKNENDALREENAALCKKNAVWEKESAFLQEKNDTLQDENAVLQARVAVLEEANKQERQLNNLLSYTGKPQKDNLGGGDCE